MVCLNVLRTIVTFISHALSARRMRRHLANLPWAPGSPLNQTLLAEASGVTTCLCIHSVCNTHTPIRCIYYARGLTITSHIWSSKHPYPCVNTSACYSTKTRCREQRVTFFNSKWRLCLCYAVNEVKLHLNSASWWNLVSRHQTPHWNTRHRNTH